MPKLTVDIAKRKNRYCAHCENFRKCDHYCVIKCSIVSCWSCCENFQWRKKIMDTYRKENRTDGK